MGRPKMDPTKKPDPRINIAFYDDNLVFLRHAAWKNHMSITQYVNQLVTKDKANYAPEEWQEQEGEGANV